VDPVADALNRLAAILAGNVRVTTLEGGTGRNIFQGFIGDAITGTTAVVVWTPNPGKRYRLRGFSITAIVKTVLAAANVGVLYFHDSSNAQYVVAPCGSFAATEAAGTIITGSDCGSLTVNLHEGVRGSAVDTTLKLGASLDIGAGAIRYCGVVWGVEEDG
jgi:hypothetical protein